MAKAAAAGIAVRARDTGRVLMLQRAEAGKNDHVWEFPGGKIDGDEEPFDAAKREWEEEVGLKLPDGHLADKWKDGVYRGFVWVIGHESDIDLMDRKDPENDEVLAWWDAKDAKNNPALRAELDDSTDKWVDAVKFYPGYTKSDLFKSPGDLVNEIEALQGLFASQANAGLMNQEASDKICSYFAKALTLLRIQKGDAVGHEFHGNRYTGGRGGRQGSETDKEFWSRIQSLSMNAPVHEEERAKFTEQVKDVAARVKNLAMRAMSSPDSTMKAVVVVSALRAVALGLSLAAGHALLSPGTHIPMDVGGGHLPSEPPPMVTNPDSPPVPLGDQSQEPPPLSGYVPGGTPSFVSNPNWIRDEYPGSSVLPHKAMRATFFKGDSPGHEFRGNQYSGKIGSNTDGGRWVPESADHAAALERLVAMPGVGTKTIDGEEIKDAIRTPLQASGMSKDDVAARVREAGAVRQTTESVDPKTLHGTNEFVSRRSVANAMKGAVQGPGGSHYRAGYVLQVARIGGQNYVLDGNHRACAAAVLDRPVDAHVYHVS